VGAFSFHCLSFTATLVALGLHLHFHAHAHLDHLEHLALAPARGTSLELAVLGARASALGAVNVLVHIQMVFGAIIHLL
jgi:hypothetical protein